ncbi:MAG: MBL fold metallo-hydrolase [Deltaproteobacteria bacterium]|nr:MBL fold metallo-hydrolase [Deltaproteobacteria bacterium]
MKFGRFNVSSHNLGFLKLDGGSMFGAVPKNLWNKLIPADDQNRIRLAARSLVISDGQRKILVDVGCGDKWDEKRAEIFAIENFPESQWGFNPEEITDVIFTHLHFDHAGGISRWANQEGGDIKPCYPKAIAHITSANFANAKHPNQREKASYLPENVSALEMMKEVNFTSGSQEIYPDLWVHQCDGHTIGQQWIEIKDGSKSIMFATDVVPTSKHLPVPFNMGYDIHAALLMQEKDEFLKKAVDSESIVAFQHDPEISAATITQDKRGHYCVKEVVEL